VAVLAGIALGISLAGGGGGDDETVDTNVAQARPVEVAGTPLAPLGDGDDPAVGTPAPTLTGEGFDGEPVEIADDGRPKVVVFLAHWCPHCQREVPVLVDWVESGAKPDDVDLYGVATSTSPDRPNYPPSAWLEREGWTQPTLVDSEDSTAAAAYGLSAFPFFTAIDSDGNVAGRVTGELTPEELEALFDLARSGGSGSSTR
jgi:thiol-disulfide isomerase/thioredoxin